METPRVFVDLARHDMETASVLLRTRLETLMMRVMAPAAKVKESERDIEEILSAIPTWSGMNADRPEVVADDLCELNRLFGSHPELGIILREEINRLRKQAPKQRRFERRNPTVRVPRGAWRRAGEGRELGRPAPRHVSLSALQQPFVSTDRR